MEVRELGEFGLLELLTQIATESDAACYSDPDLVIGIGDDAAAWQSYNEVQLGTTDMLVQDVHFTLNEISWHDLGWKSLAVNISDIAAMGGVPKYAVISLGLPSTAEVEHIADLYRGMVEIACRFEMKIAGGDITEAPQLIIGPCVIGETKKNEMLTRSAAKPGDLVAVTGYLGASAAGLRMIREKLEFAPEIESVLREAHHRPCPRITEGQLLAQNGLKAAIDISDGLIADLGHICGMSRVEARVHLQAIPIHPTVRAAFGEDALGLALSGGEDYELLFTATGESIEKLKACWDVSLPMTVIGEIVEGNPGQVTLLDEGGKMVEWAKGGWKHFGDNS